MKNHTHIVCHRPLPASWRVGFLLLLCLVVLPLAAHAAATEADALSFYQTSLDALQRDAGAWTKRMIPLVPQPDVTISGGEITYQVAVPAFRAGAGAGENGQARLQSLLEGFLAPAGGTQVTLTATVHPGTGQLSWKKKAGMDALAATFKKVAASAKKSYGNKVLAATVEDALFPSFAQMPKKRPDSPVPLSVQAWYGEMMAQAFDLTEEEANARFPYVAMLVDVSKVDLTDSPLSAVLKLKVRNWSFMVEKAVPIAKQKVEALMGAKDQERTVYAALFGEAMGEVLPRVYYSGKKPETVDVTVDLVAVAKDGMAVSEPLKQWLTPFHQAVDHAVDQLMAYGATLPYYPRVPLIDAGILSGSDDPDGMRVTLRTPMDQQLHGFVRVYKGGDHLFSGFVRKGVRLSIRLRPGTYQVRCGVGPDWFGESIVFGKEASYGQFDLSIEQGSAYDVVLGQPGASMEAITFEQMVEKP